MAVCENCSSLGDVKSDLSEKKDVRKKIVKNKRSGLNSSINLKAERILRRDYGRLVRKARESEGLTMEDLAANLSEKESVIRRVENEELRPDKDLSKKLQRELEVDLFEEFDVSSGELKRDSNQDLTVGDVTKIK